MSSRCCWVIRVHRSVGFRSQGSYSPGLSVTMATHHHHQQHSSQASRTQTDVMKDGRETLKLETETETRLTSWCEDETSKMRRCYFSRCDRDVKLHIVLTAAVQLGLYFTFISSWYSRTQHTQPKYTSLLCVSCITWMWSPTAASPQFTAPS